MKKTLLILTAVLLGFPSWADDLKPAPLDQAIKEYGVLMNAKDIDPMNHVVWKVYVYDSQSYQSGGIRYLDQDNLTAGLTPTPGYYVYLPINQLYNYLRPMPKTGDVVAVEGRVVDNGRYLQGTGDSAKGAKVLLLSLANAVKLPN